METPIWSAYRPARFAISSRLRTLGPRSKTRRHDHVLVLECINPLQRPGVTSHSFLTSPQSPTLNSFWKTHNVSNIIASVITWRFFCFCPLWLTHNFQSLHKSIIFHQIHQSYSSLLFCYVLVMGLTPPSNKNSVASRALPRTFLGRGAPLSRPHPMKPHDSSKNPWICCCVLPSHSFPSKTPNLPLQWNRDNRENKEYIILTMVQVYVHRSWVHMVWYNSTVASGHVLVCNHLVQ